MKYVSKSKGSGRGLLVIVLDTSLYSRGFDSHTGHGSLLKLMQFHLPHYTQLQRSTNIVGWHCWVGTCDGVASCPGESVRLHSSCLR